MAIEPPDQDDSVSPSDLEKPYLTPTEVSSEPIGSQFIGSKGMWLLLVGSIAIGGSAYALFTPRQSDHIRNFGNTRGGPPADFDVEFDDYVGDFGGERRAYPIEVPDLEQGEEALQSDKPDQD
jgi:hypothetical protein